MSTPCRRCAPSTGAARVVPRHILGLDGYLDKVLMKTRLAAESVPVPRWVWLDDMGPVSDGLGLPQALTCPSWPSPGSGRTCITCRSSPLLISGRGGSVVRARVRVNRGVTQQAGNYFVSTLVVNGEYTPVLVGHYLSSLLPSPEVPQFLGAVHVPRSHLLQLQSASVTGCAHPQVNAAFPLPLKSSCVAEISSS